MGKNFAKGKKDKAKRVESPDKRLTISLTKPRMLSRQGEQLLSAAGFPDWVVDNEESYLQLAEHWGNLENWEKLAELRKTLRERVLVSPVFDSEKFAQDWTALIREIWRAACSKN